MAGEKENIYQLEGVLSGFVISDGFLAKALCEIKRRPYLFANWASFTNLERR